MSLEIDPARSTLKIFTYAEGLLAKLAHDLQLSASFGEGRAQERGDRVEVTLRVPLASMRVEGVVKGGRLDRQVLSGKDQEDILAKMRSEVFGGAAVDAALVVSGELRGARFEGTLTAPSGKSAPIRAEVRRRVEPEVERAEGSLDLSLLALGSGRIKGPLGAFRVSDRVHVEFDAAFLARS